MLASLILQEHLHIIEKWLKKWKIKFKESKSSHIAYSLPSGKAIPCCQQKPNYHTSNRNSKILRDYTSIAG
jgi:hypothetical protein